MAIKTLSYSNVEEHKLEEIKERFLREAEAAGRLSHPNIVTIYDVGEEHDMAYMAMELLMGTELSERCRKSKLLPVKKALKTVSAVAEALDYAHSLENKVVLIDGVRLAQLMIEHNLGVSAVTAYEIKRIDSDYFVED